MEQDDASLNGRRSRNLLVLGQGVRRIVLNSILGSMLATFAFSLYLIVLPGKIPIEVRTGRQTRPTCSVRVTREHTHSRVDIR